MMKNVAVSLVVALAVVIPCVVWLQNKQINVAYVDLNQVYADFEMKKELEKKFESVTQKRNYMTDSLELQLKILGNTIEGAANKKEAEGKIAEFERKKQEYLMVKQNFEQDNDRVLEEYEQQIWKQINQYMKDFGKQNDYTYILGAEGSGQLMYAEEGKNITKEVTEYINKKYKGQIK